MKKILPIVTLLSLGGLFVGYGMSNNNEKPTNFNDSIDEFKKNVENYTNMTNTNLISTKLNKYAIKVSAPFNEENPDSSIKNYGNSYAQPLMNNDIDTNIAENVDNQTIIDNDINIIEPNETDNNENNVLENNNESNLDNADFPENENKLSTLYSLSNDINESCDEFCNLKEKITNAILETETLINKLQNKEIDLTAEQRMFINEQSHQLKNLSRQLSRKTTELSLSLSDLNEILNGNNDIDKLSLKYMIVLDNIINGNEMLENGLYSLNMINQMFNMTAPLPPNNQGRILYGFKKNDDKPIVKDYLIDENGNLQENNTEANQSNENENKNIDTIDTNKKFQSNIDTYVGDNPKNIDSFFNTALLDNEFMYGNGYNGMNGFNPYFNRNYVNNNVGNNVSNNNTGIQNQDNTQHIDKKSKKFKITKNIDTYRDDNTPTPKMRFSNIKQSVSDFLSRIKNKT